jgi:hypothetical protein
MNDKHLAKLISVILLVSSISIGQWITKHPGDTIALVLGTVAALIGLIIVARGGEDQRFIVRLWLTALGIRIIAAFMVYSAGMRNSIAPDWSTYDFFGDLLSRYWLGDPEVRQAWVLGAISQYRSGWGMYYYVASIYTIAGRNAFLIQLLSCVFSASACVLIYRIARFVHPEIKVARLSSILAAIAPSMVIWGSQGIKEPLIGFCLCLSLYLTLKLSNRLHLGEAVLLGLALFSLYGLRYYVSFVVLVAVCGALLLGGKRFTPLRVLQGSILVLALGFMFAFYGAGDVAERAFNLERLQSGRVWSARVSDSGYGGDVDISDTKQALSYLPLGVAYFLFAPFPWMIRNTNHILLLPELVIWWLAIPFLLLGFWHTARHRLRTSLAICLFTIGLTFAYALYLTNFGTAHRMRVQVLGFLIIFVSIGWHELRSALVRRRNRAGLRDRRFDRLSPVITR